MKTMIVTMFIISTLLISFTLIWGGWLIVRGADFSQPSIYAIVYLGLAFLSILVTILTLSLGRSRAELPHVSVRSISRRVSEPVGMDQN
ncbi:MAG TPA: hypothetical protein VGK00_12960 [Anaerolineales bacterium]|jgi:hypothetical protein